MVAAAVMLAASLTLGAEHGPRYGLHGDVSQAVTTRYFVVMEDGEFVPSKPNENHRRTDIRFDRDGIILQDHLGNVYDWASPRRLRSGNHPYSKVEVDALGRVVAYDDHDPADDDESDFRVTYIYNDLNQLVKVEYAGLTEVSEISYTYNDQGLIEVLTGSGTYEGGGEWTLEERYDYLQFDARGNWTERLVTVRSTELDDEGNPVEDEDDDGDSVLYQMDVREVKYY